MVAMLGRTAEALPARLKSIELAERLVERSPAVVSYRNRLAAYLGGLGELHLKSGRVDEAAGAIRRQREILEDLARTNASDPDIS
jgi:hypothetical protein